jgi:hypothetical protein
MHRKGAGLARLAFRSGTRWRGVALRDGLTALRLARRRGQRTGYHLAEKVRLRSWKGAAHSVCASWCCRSWQSAQNGPPLFIVGDPQPWQAISKSGTGALIVAPKTRVSIASKFSPWITGNVASGFGPSGNWRLYSLSASTSHDRQPRPPHHLQSRYAPLALTLGVNGMGLPFPAGEFAQHRQGALQVGESPLEITAHELAHRRRL